jgi:hypothetical protein
LGHRENKHLANAAKRGRRSEKEMLSRQPTPAAKEIVSNTIDFWVWFLVIAASYSLVQPCILRSNQTGVCRDSKENRPMI